MIRMQLQIDLTYEVNTGGADFVFNVHAAKTARQTVVEEHLSLSQDVNHAVDTDPVNGTRYLRLHAEPGDLALSYTATLDLDHYRDDPKTISETSVCDMPASALDYIFPSRYCQSDRLLQFAQNEFGAMPRGYSRVLAIQAWVQKHVTFTSNSSTFTTSAVDTLIERVGVCRDFAHLMIALCRAVNIPARLATGTDYGADPALGPPDFHAYVEVFLGKRWYIFDASGTGIPLGFVRFGTGRDAADVAFASMFGSVNSHAPTIKTEAVDDPKRGMEVPQHCDDAVSTDAGGLTRG